MKEAKPKSVQLKIKLPVSLAREAEARGLLTSEALESLLRAELRRQRVERMFNGADRLASLAMPPMTEAEVEAEIQAVRVAKHSRDSRCS
jgi:post-segregation antitoxin (ccd killing protein)